MTCLVNINYPITPIIKLPSCPNNSRRLEIVSGIESAGVTGWFGTKSHMETLEGLADDVFNVLPIVICYPFHYFLYVIIGNNRIEKAYHLCLIIRVNFVCGFTAP